MKLCTCDCKHEDNCQINYRPCSMCDGRGGGWGDGPVHDRDWLMCKNCDGKGRVRKEIKETILFPS